MNKLFIYLKEAAQRLLYIMSGSAVNDVEIDNKMLYQQLQNYLLNRNCRNVVLFSALTSILSFVHIIIAFMNNTSSKLILIIGLSLILLSGVICFSVALVRLAERKIKDSKLKSVIYSFWIAFEAGMLFVSVYDIINSKFSYAYIIMLITFSAVPLLEVRVLAVMHGVSLVTVVIASIAAGISIVSMLLIAAITIVMFLLSCLIYGLRTENWANHKQIDTLNERCRQISEKDAVTGMLNKNGLIKKLKESTNGTDYHQTIAAIFVDIDHFKGYNRMYGYEESDKCLYNVCNCIRIISKMKTDIISRFGGDEFIVVLEDTDEYELVDFAEQIRSSIETMALPFGEEIITITVGVSSVCKIGEVSYAQIISEAEQNLDIAKNAGRNCIGYKNHVFKKE